MLAGRCVVWQDEALLEEARRRLSWASAQQRRVGASSCAHCLNADLAQMVFGSPLSSGVEPE